MQRYLNMGWMFFVLLALPVWAVMPDGRAFGSEAGVRQILWETAGHLPAARGFRESIGFAGMMSGAADGYVLVGGGANFPYERAANGGVKETYDDLYLFKPGAGKLQLLARQSFGHKIAYGASVSAPEGVYYLGGGSDDETAKAITLFSVNVRREIAFEQVGALPFSWMNGVAAYAGGKIYLGLGKQDGKLSNRFYVFDLKTKALTELAPFPGEAREQAVAQILGGKFVVFGGGSSVAYTDGWQYDLRAGAWSKAAEVRSGGKAISLLGASSVKLGEREMLVIGGFNKTVYDDAVKNLTSLKGDALAAFRNAYFDRDPEDFAWNREILIYDGETGQWRSIGEVPFDAPCGAGLVRVGGTIVSLGGEIKPGVRTNRMYMGTIR